MVGQGKTKLVMIDDDAALIEMLQEFMAMHGYQVMGALEPEAGMALIAKEKPRLLILDGMLPQKDGFTVCREVRQQSQLPIIMLTARGAVADRIQGLKAGADDYLPKPFEADELLARVESVMRRSHRVVVEEGECRFGDLRILPTERKAFVGDMPLSLTTAEFDLLYFFASRPGETLNRDQICEGLKGTEWSIYSRSLDVVMSRLRKKLADDPKEPRFFKTIWGSGYVFIGRPQG